MKNVILSSRLSVSLAEIRTNAPKSLTIGFLRGSLSLLVFFILILQFFQLEYHLHLNPFQKKNF